MLLACTAGSYQDAWPPDDAKQMLGAASGRLYGDPHILNVTNILLWSEHLSSSARFVGALHISQWCLLVR